MDHLVTIPRNHPLTSHVPFKERIFNYILIYPKVFFTKFYKSIITFKILSSKNKINEETFKELFKNLVLTKTEYIKSPTEENKKIYIKAQRKMKKFFKFKNKNHPFLYYGRKQNLNFTESIIKWLWIEPNVFFTNLSGSIIAFRITPPKYIPDEEIREILKESKKTTKLIKQIQSLMNKGYNPELDYRVQIRLENFLKELYAIQEHNREIYKMYKQAEREKMIERVHNINDLIHTYKDMGVDNPILYKHLRQFDYQTKETIIANLRYINYKLEWLMYENFRLVDQIRLKKQIDPNFVINIADQHTIYDYFFNIDVQIKLFNLYKANYPKLLASLPENEKFEKLVWKFEKSKSNAWSQGYIHPDYLPEKAKMLKEPLKIFWDPTATLYAKIDALITLFPHTKIWAHEKVLCILVIILILLIIILIILLLKKIISSVFHIISKYKK